MKNMIATGVAVLAIGGPALAQDSPEKFYARQSLRPAAASETPSDGLDGAWNAGEWSPWSSTCGEATRTRSVSCMAAGEIVGDEMCSAERPLAQEEDYLVSGCQNLFGDPSFENGSSWAAMPSGIMGTENPHSGSRYVSATTLTQVVTLEPGRSYHVSIFSRGCSRVRYLVRDDSPNSSYDVLSNSGDIPETGWQNVSFTFEAQSANSQIRFLGGCSYDTASIVQVG